MNKQQFYTTKFLQINTTISIEEDTSHHVAKVCRAKPKDIVLLFNGDGFIYTAILESINSTNISVYIKEKHKANTESNLRIHLAQSLAKGDRMDYCIQKSVELGVNSITPLLAKRSIVKITDKNIEKKLSHWRKIAISAAEQSKRGMAPSILEPIDCENWFKSGKYAHNYILTTSKGSSIKNLNRASEISITVGPEGDFTPEEERLAKANGFVSISLGPRILRTETAAPAAIAALQLWMGDF